MVWRGMIWKGDGMEGVWYGGDMIWTEDNNNNIYLKSNIQCT